MYFWCILDGCWRYFWRSFGLKIDQVPKHANVRIVYEKPYEIKIRPSNNKETFDSNSVNIGDAFWNAVFIDFLMIPASILGVFSHQKWIEKWNKILSGFGLAKRRTWAGLWVPFFGVWRRLGATRPSALCHFNIKTSVPFQRERYFLKTGFGVPWEYILLSIYSGSLWWNDKEGTTNEAQTRHCRAVHGGGYFGAGSH